MTTKRAVLYARVSSDDRGKDGRNLAGQLEMCRDYALAHGYRIIAELAEDDRGASGAAFELEQLSRIRALAGAGEFDVLVAREIDRLSRNLAKQLIVEEELKRSGVQIEYVLGDYPDTPEGGLMKNVKASIAEYERLKISERNTRGRRQKVKSGSVMIHGRPPYGYREVKNNGRFLLAIHEPEAHVVRLIFTWYLYGDGERGPMSLYAIAARLTAEGIPSMGDSPNVLVKKRMQAGKWARSTIWRIIGNETYAGKWYYSKAKKLDGVTIRAPKEDWVSLDVPAIIDPETWQMAQQRRMANRRKAPRNTKHEYLLQHRAICGSCGTKLYMRSGHGSYGYYSCPVVGDKDRLKTCRAPNFRADHVDAAVWDWIKMILGIPEELLGGLQDHQAQTELANRPITDRLTVVEDLLADQQRQLERLLDLYLSGEFPREMLVQRKTQLESAIEALNSERASLAAKLEERTLTTEQIQGLQRFAAEVAEGLDEADEDFAMRRRIVETLDVQATLSVEDGKKWAWVSCVLRTEPESVSVAPTSS